MRKGFTLVELLAVIVVLGVIALITFPIVSNSMANAKQKAYDSQVSFITESARKWSIDNTSSLSETKAISVKISTLISAGYITKTKDGVLYNPMDDTKTMSGCVIIKYSSSYNQYVYNYSEECAIPVYTDSSGANAPDLLDKMVAVKYDGTNWVAADTTQEWYNYGTKNWANAVVLNTGVTKTVGDTINIDTEVAQMYVWIPRYKYTIFNGNNGSVPVQEITVEFETGIAKTGSVHCNETLGTQSTSEDCGTVTNNSSTYTHPAFTFGTQELTGIWVGKFENSAPTATSDTVQVVKILPNVVSWRSATVSTFNTSIKNIKTDYAMANSDTHMMKNMEWGAVAYLKQSQYGLGIPDIGINNNNTYKTGCGAASGSAAAATCDAYNTVNGQKASTTGTIYGIYDMSGGAWEYVMGNMINSSGTFYSSSAGFSTNPESKYYNAYSYDASSNITHSRGKLGDATKETLATYGNTTGGWNGDYARFPYSTTSWFVRGGYCSNGASAGVMSFSCSSGYAGSNYAARSVITAQ